MLVFVCLLVVVLLLFCCFVFRVQCCCVLYWSVLVGCLVEIKGKSQIEDKELRVMVIGERARHYHGVPMRNLQYVYMYMWTYVRDNSSAGAY